MSEAEKEPVQTDGVFLNLAPFRQSLRDAAFCLVDWPRILKPWKPRWHIRWNWTPSLSASDMTLEEVRGMMQGWLNEIKWKAERLARDRLWLIRPAKMTWKEGLRL